MTLSAEAAPTRWRASIGAVLLGLLANAVPATLAGAALAGRKPARVP